LLLADAIGMTRRLDVAEVLSALEGQGPPFDALVPHAAASWMRTVLERALGFLRDTADPALASALADAGRAVGLLGDLSAAHALLDEATSRAAGDEVMLRGIRNATARVAMLAVNASAVIGLLDESTLPDEPVARHQAMLLLATAIVMVHGPSALDRGLDLIRRAEALDDPLAAVERARARMACFAFGGEHARSAQAADEGAALARRAGLRFAECAQLHNAAEQYCLSGDLPRTRARLLDSTAMARDLGADLIERHNDMLLAYLDRDAARLAQIAEAMRAEGHPSLDLHAHQWLGRLLAETRAPGARAAFQRTRQIASDLAIRHVVDDCDRALASLDAS
jgi:hypothetical protein